MASCNQFKVNMSEGSSCCDKICPCKVTRKRIVMTMMAICCFLLTAWTVIITGQAKGSTPQNVSLVFIDDSKSVDNLNITLSSKLILDAATKAQDKKNSAIMEAMKKATTNKKTALRVVRVPPEAGTPNLMDEERPALCKCLCGMNVTAEEMLEAMLYIVESKKSGFDPEASLMTTTTTPKPMVGWK